MHQFFIGGRNSYVEKYFNAITDWTETRDSKGNKVFVGETELTPFEKDKHNQTYRLVIRKQKSKSKQTGLFTQDDYEYRPIVTNNKGKNAAEVYPFLQPKGRYGKTVWYTEKRFWVGPYAFFQLGRQQRVFIFCSYVQKPLQQYHKGILKKT